MSDGFIFFVTFVVIIISILLTIQSYYLSLKKNIFGVALAFFNILFFVLVPCCILLYWNAKIKETMKFQNEYFKIKLNILKEEKK